MTLLPEDLHSEPESIVSRFLLPQDLADQDLILVTRKGRIKRLPLEDCASLTGRGLTLTKLKDEDEVKVVIPASAGQSIVLATSGGRVLRFLLDDSQLPYGSRNNQGTKGIRMRSTEQIVGCAALYRKDDLLLVTEKGYMKRTPASLLSLGHVGDLGNLGMTFGLKQDRLASIANAPGERSPPSTPIKATSPTSPWMPFASIAKTARECDRSSPIAANASSASQC
ncbi:MAG: hypothetical protein HC824_08475 [Synechococcales cyanobacterium RM1_1_8]|nr:hypothetical protein [Synechococcales cyanobacterium RM1_1_8]